MTVRAAQRQVVTERLAGHLLASGLSRTSVRQLAAAAGVSDRMLLNYLGDKAELPKDAMTQLAGQLGDPPATALPPNSMHPSLAKPLCRKAKLRRSFPRHHL